jgi:predicted acyltransferase
MDRADALTSEPAAEVSAVPPADVAPPVFAARRLASIDAYRGLVMFLMLAEVLEFGTIARNVPDSPFWGFLAHHQDHVEWVGCSLHDLIQPSFSFLVGTALAFSLAKRAALGQSAAWLVGHALWRALVLVFLGIFLRSLGRERTNYTFEDTLTQIGLGYPFLFALGLRPRRDQWIALVLILVGIWAAFALYSPPADHDYAAVGVSADWLREHGLTGFAGQHWQKNGNLAWAFDRWFLNLFPREAPFTHNGGGYATLSFVPTLATMILGLIAGGWLREPGWTPARRLGHLVVAGLAGLALGWGLGALGVCPVVKRIWTPSWTLFSGGWCFLILAGFYAVIDAAGWRAWSGPLRVIGVNSIAAYLMSWLWKGFIGENLTRHLGEGPFRAFGEAYEPLVHGAAVLLVIWLILWWMDRKKIYLKI